VSTGPWLPIHYECMYGSFIVVFDIWQPRHNVETNILKSRFYAKKSYFFQF
jgi:hypothetical protein